MFRKILDRGEAGDNVGIPLEFKKKTSKRNGYFKPGSVKPHATFS
jgi:translation elongation factor EF-Tu-like GTPase